MGADGIAEIRIDATGRLCVTPTSQAFPLVYRAGMEVCWDEKEKFLYSPVPGEWSFARWFRQIIVATASEYGCTLVVTPRTSWYNVDPLVQSEIVADLQVNDA